MRKTFIVSMLALSIATGSGCAQMGINKQQAGTVLGAVAGVVAGSFIGKGKGRVLAAIVAGSIGGYIGNKIGAMLDEKDQQALALRTQEALNAAPAGASAPVTWTSAHSGASAQIAQGPEFSKSQTVEVKRAPKIAAVPSMKLINEQYVTKSSANVRAAPNLSAEKVGGLKPGTEFTAVGSTGDWILVGRKGVTVGYISKSLVSPRAEMPVKVAKAPINLDEMDVASSKETQAFDLDSIPTLPTQQVVAQTSCRPVTVSLKAADGKTEQEQNTFCKQANGTWELI